MSKRKTSFSIDEKLWRKWNKFVVEKTGSSRKGSLELENAMKEYMEKNKIEPDKT
jgi:hypothetical protein